MLEVGLGACGLWQWCVGGIWPAVLLRCTQQRAAQGGGAKAKEEVFQTFALQAL